MSRENNVKIQSLKKKCVFCGITNEIGKGCKYRNHYPYLLGDLEIFDIKPTLNRRSRFINDTFSSKFDCK